MKLQQLMQIVLLFGAVESALAFQLESSGNSCLFFNRDYERVEWKNCDDQWSQTDGFRVEGIAPMLDTLKIYGDQSGKIFLSDYRVMSQRPRTFDYLTLEENQDETKLYLAAIGIETSNQIYCVSQPGHLNPHLGYIDAPHMLPVVMKGYFPDYAASGCAEFKLRD